MGEVRVYEPALCCRTGVCGPELDQALVTFTADVAHVNSSGGSGGSAGSGGSVARHNLASDPEAFIESDGIRGFLHVVGSEGLPVTTVDGVTVLTGRYPTREQLLRYAGLNRGDGASTVAQEERRGLPLLTRVSSDAASAPPSRGEGCC
ncbi:arsenite efflux transporter metallochaperone ArsD [Intrasporangium calvum]|uniref:Arsenical resistance operon trans-acting repressor ArsD n=1 Tax=Intrasporangium calvum (strain ATCC 23552 / DSM 43043 / JCM 3097 / NBRC 12989 / NCIMB 10167 / NRRL B-3866 / 7 KIP) TaxID=710696 RepID=E6SD04_INTC7|nr:arsenite efflux transporter metallochaperone ArsD [Intrasporangium calvum]ADU48592.1 Arsenical resistance operon trans-acting repressor ArsD [Intrasporangium calvum DSM 43043]